MMSAHLILGLSRSSSGWSVRGLPSFTMSPLDFLQRVRRRRRQRRGGRLGRRIMVLRRSFEMFGGTLSVALFFSFFFFLKVGSWELGLLVFFNFLYLRA